MKSIMKAVLFLLILFFTNQSSTQDLTSIFNSIGKSVFDHLMEINVKEYENEKNENKNEKNIPNEQNPIFGPYEIDLIGEVLVSIIKCKTITDRLYSLDLGLEYNISYILNKTEEILGSKKFDSILIGIFTKINIFDFEAWLKLIRGIIEIIAELPAISENKFEYVINYRDGHLEYIPKERLDYYNFRKQKKLIIINELLNKLENFIFYCFKFYSFATLNSFDDYAERFAGTTFSNLFDGLSPITFLFKDYFKVIGKNDVYMENFLIEVSNSLSKYFYRKLGFKIFLNAIKKFLGPIGLLIDVASFSYNIGYKATESIYEYFNS